MKEEEDKPHFNEWGGAFSCMTPGCWEAASVAKYFPKERTLIWLCPQNHKNVLEDMDE